MFHFKRKSLVLDCQHCNELRTHPLLYLHQPQMEYSNLAMHSSALFYYYHEFCHCLLMGHQWALTKNDFIIDGSSSVQLTSLPVERTTTRGLS